MSNADTRRRARRKAKRSADKVRPAQRKRIRLIESLLEQPPNVGYLTHLEASVLLLDLEAAYRTSFGQPLANPGGVT
jgi:hypothetical protein